MKIFWRIVVLSWCLTLGSCAFVGVHAGDHDPQQWSSVMSFMAIAFGTWLLTVTFCFIMCFVKTIPRKSPDSNESESKSTDK